MVFSENVRVNPVTGTLMEARPDIHQSLSSQTRLPDGK